MINKYKKLISLLLVIVMACSLSVSVFATTDYTTGTDVTYNPADPDGIPNSGDEVDLEAYTITVPAALKPNQCGTVTLTGTWASNRVVTVTSDTSVELTNSIDANNKKTLTVTFAGISEAGSNTEAQTFTETVAVGEITNALFGTWSGKFNYNVEINNIDTNALVLEGDGQTFHKMAPTTLTFRSTAPLDEFQDVLVNGEVVDPSNYTLTEGSTIVTLNIDYLKTLDVDTHEITVVSDSGSPSAGFEVIEPEVNNYNFYYNQPYAAYVEDFGEKCAFFMHENGSMEIIAIGAISTGVLPASYEIVENGIKITSELGVFTGIPSEDGKAVYCQELGIDFVIGDESIVADEEYVYTLNEYNGGYRVTVIDKTKTTYGPIKTGINGIPTTNLESTFWECVNLVNPPEIPYGITNMDSAFAFCTSLKVAPEIPASVTGMIAAFSGCTSLEKAPTIPAGVVDLSSTFYNCHSLKGEIEINTNDIDITNGNAYLGCFKNTVHEIIITGTASDEIKATLAGTAENGNVIY